MEKLFQLAYVLALGLWIPLAILAALHPQVRRRLLLPLAASALAAAYEAYMTLVWSHTVSNPIRVDVLFVMAALGIVDGLAGLGLRGGARRQADRRPLKIAANLCLSVPALAVAGFVAMYASTAGLDRELDLARRFRFEAYFRDNDTQKRVFGDLTPVKNPWAGYYVGTGSDDRFAHLVVNDDGRFWIYHALLYVREGTGRPTSAGEFSGTGAGRTDADMKMTLRRQDGGPFLLEVHQGIIPEPPNARPAPMRKADPPRFPRPSSASDEVHFVGVFSGTYGERADEFWLSQVWLWESRGSWWGQYLRDPYTRGAMRDFISTEAIDPKCSEDCRVLSFKTSRGPVTLTRVSPDAFTATQAGEHNQVTLKRGETLPGFFLDLAPVATKAENRQWINAVTTGNMITWTAPPE